MEKQKEIAAGQFREKQVFGSCEGRDPMEEDLITCLKFDPTGEYLSLGDQEGRVIIFRESESRSEYEYFA